MGLVARDMGRASMPSSVCSCRNVNCVGRNVKPAGFSGSIARVLGVSAREDTIRVRKPRGGPANASTSDVPWGRNAIAVFGDSDREEGVTPKLAKAAEGNLIGECRASQFPKREFLVSRFGLRASR